MMNPHLADNVSVDIHHYETTLGSCHVDLLVVRGPGPGGEAAVLGQHGGPVPLAGHGAHQHEPVLVADERHPAIVRPGEGGDGSVAVVDQLDAPAAFVLYPDENNASGVTGGQLLIGFIPFDHRNLESAK